MSIDLAKGYVTPFGGSCWPVTLPTPGSLRSPGQLRRPFQGLSGHAFLRHFQPTRSGLTDIRECFRQCLPFGDTAGQGGDFGPETTLFRGMNDESKFHGRASNETKKRNSSWMNYTTSHKTRAARLLEVAGLGVIRARGT